MPHPFKISPIHGISAGYALDGELATVQLAGFYSTEDGQQFITIAEQLTNALALPLQALGVRPSQIDSLLAIIDTNGSGTLYCNELKYELVGRPNRTLKAGEGLTDDDILDIEEMHLRTIIDGAPVDPPKDFALVFVFSSGWRKGLYFNFAPLHLDQPKTLPDLASLFGALFCRLRFQENSRSMTSSGRV